MGTESAFPGQSVYVPWLSCIDGNDDNKAACYKQVGIEPADIEECLKSDIKELLKTYIEKDGPIHATPTVHVNGWNVHNLSFRNIRAHICAADRSLSGCTAPEPPNADWQPEIQEVPPLADDV